MSEHPTPINDLDRALLALAKSPSAAPDFYRQLGEGTLWFFVPYHPEVEGHTVELKNGMQLPFVQLKSEDQQAVAMYSSSERADEAIATFGYGPRQYSAAGMDAKMALSLLGQIHMHAVLNAGCQTGSILLPPNLLRDVASGDAFKPAASLEEMDHVQGALRMLDAADYPLAIIQPLFETLRKFPNFRAAWVFLTTEQPEEAARFQIMVLMDPRDATIFHELNMVFTAVTLDQDVAMGLLDEHDTAHVATIFGQARPFYLAPDYELPPGALNLLDE